MADAIHNEFLAETSPEAVISALTTPNGIRGWWSKDSEVGTGEGANHELRFLKEGNTVNMKFKVEEVSSDRVRWRCTDNGNPVWVDTTLTWEAHRDGSQTRVRFTHDGFKGEPSPPYAMTVEGWKHFCASLKSFLETGAGQPW